MEMSLLFGGCSTKLIGYIDVAGLGVHDLNHNLWRALHNARLNIFLLTSHLVRQHNTIVTILKLRPIVARF